MDLSDHDWYLLSKDDQNSAWKATKRYLTGLLQAQQSLIITKTFNFPNDGACIGLWHLGQQLDEWCYVAVVQPKIQKTTTGATLTGIEEDNLDNILYSKILGMMPNPKGKDDNESITLQISGLTLPYTGLFIKFATHKKPLPIITNS